MPAPQWQMYVFLGVMASTIFGLALAFNHFVLEPYVSRPFKQLVQGNTAQGNDSTIKSFQKLVQEDKAQQAVDTDLKVITISRLSNATQVNQNSSAVRPLSSLVILCNAQKTVLTTTIPQTSQTASVELKFGDEDRKYCETVFPQPNFP